MFHTEPLKYFIGIFPLADKDPFTALHYFNTKEIFHLPEIGHVKLLLHGFFECFEHSCIISCENKIVNINANQQ